MSIKKITTDNFTALSTINGTVILGRDGELIATFVGQIRRGNGTIEDAQCIADKMEADDFSFVGDYNMEADEENVNSRMEEICGRVVEIVCDKQYEKITPDNMHTVVPCTRDEFLQAREWYKQNLSPAAIERNKIREIELARAGAGYE